MPYNTRRISLSLPDLGIQIPGGNTARQHKSQSSSNNNNNNNTAATTTSSAQTKDADTSSHPPAKRIKRSHTMSSSSSATVASSSASPLAATRHRHSASATQASIMKEKPTEEQQQRPSTSLASHQTPPPSPGHEYRRSAKLDTEGINDEVVLATLNQLETTGNRPHLIKELAMILRNTSKVVQGSSNPTAIISSRLTSYMRRPWTALAPCPLAKEQVTTHPRRVYYYLTTGHRQPIPEYVEPLAHNKRIISPSISSGPDEDQDHIRFESESGEEEEDLAPSTEAVHDISLLSERSPSPELGFGPHELDVSSHIPTSHSTHHNRRGASPPLESDEREFTHTASVMQQRKQSEQAEALHRQQQASASISSASSPRDDFQMEDDAHAMPEIYIEDGAGQFDENEEFAARRNREAAAALFGSHGSHLLDIGAGGNMDLSSPLMRPVQAQDLTGDTELLMTTTRLCEKKRMWTATLIDTHSASMMPPPKKSAERSMFDAFDAWGELKSPECVELSELDDLLGAF